MRHRFLRAFLTLTTLAVVWLVASPARAATSGAPLCDPRGATTFAPPPQMQDLEVSLDIAVTEDADCAAPGLLKVHRATRDRAPAPIDLDASRAAATHAAAPFAAPCGACERLAVPAATLRRSCSGFRSTVDRPPRA